MASQKETWENPTGIHIYVKSLDSRGNIIHQYARPKGGKIFLTKEEREMNHDSAANSDLDNFLNGNLVPIRLLDGDEDTAALQNNPNILSDSEIKALFKGHHATFAKRLKEISNPLTVRRLLDAAKEDDVNASYKQVEAIQARLGEVSKGRDQEVRESSAPVSPQSALNPDLDWSQI